MTEREFWGYLEMQWQEKGRALQASGVVDMPDPELQAIGRYIGEGHALLPGGDFQDMPDKIVLEMGELLFKKDVRLDTKEAIMILLAHQPSRIAFGILEKYSGNPDKELVFYARCALDECAMWNE